IVERGKHAELLEREGLYAQVWSLQRQEREPRRQKHRASLTPVNVGVLVTDAIAAVRHTIDSKGLNLYPMLADDCLVTGDPSGLQEVVSDLVEHAVRVSRRGARAEINLRRVGNEVLLKVSDTHRSGQQADEEAAVLERFDPARLRLIVEENHGTFGVEQDTGDGNTYTV